MLLYVLDMLRNQEERRHMNAGEFLNALSDRAIEETGSREHARSLFAEWGFTRSEQVGAAIFGMVELGLLGASDSDTPESFDGLIDRHGVFSSDTGSLIKG
jgi:uncharacterized repeat protein (TIGR04138 family)